MICVVSEFHLITLEEDSDLLLEEPLPQHFVIQVTQGIFGGHSLVWDPRMKWPLGISPVMPTTPGSSIIVTVMKIDREKFYACSTGAYIC